MPCSYYPPPRPNFDLEQSTMSGVSLIAGIPVGSTLQAAQTWQQKLYGIAVPTEVEQLRHYVASTPNKILAVNAC